MKAFINGLEIPFRDLGEPEVTFEGETYNVITDQTGAPYFMYNDKAQYIELRDDDGKDITPGGDEPEPDQDEPAEPTSEELAEAYEVMTPEERKQDADNYTNEVIADAKKKTAPKTKAEPAPPKPLVKDPMMLAIEAMLNQRAQEDELFAVTLAKPNKSLKECCDYIYKEVKRIGREGYADAEILGMAVHYYDEDDIKPGSVTKPSKVIVNTPMAAPKPVELSAADKEKARQLAVDNAIKKEADRLSTKKKSVASKPAGEIQVQQSLF